MNTTTTRRGVLETILALGSASVLHSAMDEDSWRSYEALEESWIREKYALLVEQSPEAAVPAEIDLRLQLAELRRRGMQFKHAVKTHPDKLRGGAWQLTWLPDDGLSCTDVAYREQESAIQKLTRELRNDPEYTLFRQAQMRLWKTPDYKQLHRTYTGRMQELNHKPR